MRLTLIRTCLPMMTALFIAAVVCDSWATQAPTPVEVWRGGDDGLTLRLADAVVKAFKASPDFELSTGKRPGTLIVLIPTHVNWKRLGWRPFGRRTQIFYTVEFKMIVQLGERVGSIDSVRTVRGSCRDDRMADCASEIVKSASISRHQ
jgi:hypothetical protein